MRGLRRLQAVLVIIIAVGNWPSSASPLKGLVAWYTFDEASGPVVRDMSGNQNHGALSGGAERAKGLLQGGVQFNGKDGCVMIPDSPSLHIRDGLTISLWIKPGSLKPDPGRKGDAQALISKNWNWRCYIDHKGCAAAILGGDNWDTSKQYMQCPPPVNPGVWYHVACVFSRQEKRMRFYIDGQKVEERTHTIEGLRDESGQPLLLGLDPGNWNPFLGCMDEVQIYNRELTEEEIAAIRVAVSRETMASWQQALDRSQTQLRILGSSARVERDISSRLEGRIVLTKRWLTGQTHGETLAMPTAEFRKLSTNLRCLEGTLTALKQGRATLKRVIAYVVKPVSATMRLPDEFPTGGKADDTLRIVAAPGKLEPASFVLAAWDKVWRLTFKVGPLRCGSRTIPPDNVDLRVVKCWYQSGSAWRDVYQDTAHRLLVPELLLHDDALVKVDTQRRENYVKCRFPDGERYVCISRVPRGVEEEDVFAMRDARGRSIPDRAFPVQDSAALQPLDMDEGSYRQLWLTVRIPDNAGPGVYSGKITVAAEGKPLGQLQLVLRVLPFPLAQPRRHHDLQQTFISSIYNMTVLSPSGEGSLTPTGRSALQLRAELRDLRDHGVTCPTNYQINWEYNLQRLDEALRISEELGMNHDLLLLLGKEGNQGFQTDATPVSLEKLRTVVRELLRVSRRWGYRELYLYGIDEAPRDMLVAQRPLWKTIQECGVRVFVSGAGLDRPERYPDMFREMGDVLDLVVCSGRTSRAEASRWHGAGHRIAAYANPQAGLENPEIYRRNFGLTLWLDNYDGAMTFIYYADFGNPWNDFDHPTYRDHNFVYPTVDGVIDTIAWEGYREGMDDIRYATILKLSIEQAKRSGSRAMMKQAEEADRWLETVDVRHADLDEIREGIIDHILRLQAVAGSANRGSRTGTSSPRPRTMLR